MNGCPLLALRSAPPIDSMSPPGAWGCGLPYGRHDVTGRRDCALSPSHHLADPALSDKPYVAILKFESGPSERPLTRRKSYSSRRSTVASPGVPASSWRSSVARTLLSGPYLLCLFPGWSVLDSFVVAFPSDRTSRLAVGSGTPFELGVGSERTAQRFTRRVPRLRLTVSMPVRRPRVPGCETGSDGRRCLSPLREARRLDSV